MRIRMLTAFAGPDIVVKRGDDTDAFTEADARRLVAGGFAEFVDDELEAEPEAPAPKRRGRRPKSAE